jgi:hypothetical protein
MAQENKGQDHLRKSPLDSLREELKEPVKQLIAEMRKPGITPEECKQLLADMISIHKISDEELHTIILGLPYELKLLIPYGFKAGGKNPSLPDNKPGGNDDGKTPSSLSVGR